MTKYGPNNSNDSRECAAEKIAVPITKDDLKQLAEGSLKQFEDAVNAKPDSAMYKVHGGQKPVAIALCQTAAMNYHDGITTYSDFDVFLFYDKSAPHGMEDEKPARRWKKPWCYDNAKYPCGDIRVDVLVRRIEVHSKNPAEIIRHFFNAKPLSKTARCLKDAAVVLLDPPGRLGEVIWYNGEAVG